MHTTLSVQKYTFGLNDSELQQKIWVLKFHPKLTKTPRLYYIIRGLVNFSAKFIHFKFNQYQIKIIPIHVWFHKNIKIACIGVTDLANSKL